MANERVIGPSGCNPNSFGAILGNSNNPEATIDQLLDAGNIPDWCSDSSILLQSLVNQVKLVKQCKFEF